MDYFLIVKANDYIKNFSDVTTIDKTGIKTADQFCKNTMQRKTKSWNML